MHLQAHVLLKKEYKISFYAEDELIGSVVTAGREILAFPDTPEKDGYTFMGWYRDKGEWKNQFTTDEYYEPFFRVRIIL